MKTLISIRNLVLLLNMGVFLIFISCAETEEISNSIPTLNDAELPPELLTDIFTNDIPENIKNVDEFLNKIERNGMKIYRGLNPDWRFQNSFQFVFKNHCIYDESNPKNIGFRFGSYSEYLLFYYDERLIQSDLEYYSKEGEGFPEYPDFIDQGSGVKGYVTGSNEENNFTVFYRVIGSFENINYEAIWIVSFTIESPNELVPIDVTKCLVMVNKGPDPEGKVASVGAVRIFRDDEPEMDG